MEVNMGTHLDASWHRFLIDFGANLPLSSVPKSIKLRSKTDPKINPFLDGFLHGLLSHLSAILEAKLGAS